MTSFSSCTKFSLIFLLLASPATHGDVTSEVESLQKRWAEVNYQLSGREQLEAFAALSEQADQVTAANPASAAAWVWSGIIKSTHAGVKGGLGALGLAKASRSDLETALEIDAEVLEGSALASLGTLYFSVPGWPVGFGDDEKAEELLSRALAIAPENIDNNYFYAEFKRKQEEFATAREYYLRAQAAAPRPGREVADAGRQADIVKALAAMN